MLVSDEESNRLNRYAKEWLDRRELYLGMAKWCVFTFQGPVSHPQDNSAPIIPCHTPVNWYENMPLVPTFGFLVFGWNPAGDIFFVPAMTGMDRL